MVKKSPFVLIRQAVYSVDKYRIDTRTDRHDLPTTSQSDSTQLKAGNSWTRTCGGPAFSWVHCQHTKWWRATRYAPHILISPAPVISNVGVHLFIARALRHATDRQIQSQSDSIQLKAGNSFSGYTSACMACYANALVKTLNST